ncbi:MAG: TIGR04076 family protein [Candidatus Asgardarchaeia archaeon]
MGRKIVEAEVVRVKGVCSFGHKVGDKIVFDGETVKGKICYESLMMLLPKVYALQNGAYFPWEKDGIMHSACPDPENQVVYAYRVIEEDD